MPNIPEIFRGMPARYRKGTLSAPRSYYFSIGDHKYTVKLTADACVVDDGKTVDNANCVLKTTPELFEKLLAGKPPGPIDIARGKFKTNDPGALGDLKNLFGF